MSLEIPLNYDNIGVRGNPNLKRPNSVDYVTKDEYNRRIQEIIRCKNDIVYFANNYYHIISPGKGLHQIVCYKKQEELLRHFVENDRCIVLSARQSSKTTSYAIFSLWYTIFNPEKRVLIAANKRDTAIEVLTRIQLGYENLPNWIKPGLETWNKGEIIFSNRSSIKGVATGSDAARGMSANILIIDEAAFLQPNIANSFFASVYPVISSSKGTKVIIVSTPNGVGNLYHELWEKANSKTRETNEDSWKPFRMDWWDVTGRDEKWKQLQIESIGMERWNQEFQNTFLNSSFKKLVSDEVIEKHRLNIKKYKDLKITGEEIPIEGSSKTYTFKMWHDFDPNKTYLASGDVADGSAGDSSVLYIWDITDGTDIKLCAKFSSNTITTIEFSYIIARICGRYCNPILAIESNSIGRGLLDQLRYTYNYDNFVRLNKHNREGIMSHVQIKSKACIWFKEMLTTPEVTVTIYDEDLVDEFDTFIRKDTKNHLVYSAMNKSHDDHIMSAIWGLYILNAENIDKYFNVVEYIKTGLDKVLPKKIMNPFVYDINKQDKELAPTSLEAQWKKFKTEVNDITKEALDKESKAKYFEDGYITDVDEEEGENLFFNSLGEGWSAY